MTCPCDDVKQKMPKCDAGTPPVLEINSGETPVLFHTVNIPASMGDVNTLPPAPGIYRNTRVFYEADNAAYLYDSDGIPQLLTIPGPAGGVNSVNGLTGEVTLTAADVNAQPTLTAGDNITISSSNVISADGDAKNTIFYANLSESGTYRHIYKNIDMTGEVSVQDLLDANEDGQVILRMTTIATPEYFNDAYLQNTYVGNADYQFLFLDNRVYYEYDGTNTTDTSFYRSTSNIQLQMSAGQGINISGNAVSVTSAINGGTAAPTTSTAGAIGALYSYVDSGTGHIAICTDDTGGTYTWSTLI